MKIRILSDTHLETYNGKYDEKHKVQNPTFEKLVAKIESKMPRPCKKEVLVLPGDLGMVVEDGKFNPLFERFLKYLKTKWRYIIIVPGNTEYHGITSFETFNITNKMLKDKCKELGIIFLQKGVVMIDDYFFVGCTLWEYISSKDWKMLKDADKEIFMDKDVYRSEYVDNLEWLHSILTELHKQNKKAVVITHYPPNADLKNPKYTVKVDGVKKVVNHIDKFLLTHNDTIKVWICGHIHDTSFMEKVKVPIYINPVGESFEKDTKKFGSGLIKF